ncbi:DUF3520 domain-containing protein [Candidatus Poribacteria bacterium]|nr:DUF3520 domain-containing protein [Candidatus Poribacteria bacterium]MYI93296.1 DUF3520 domain-containing protein [Candidatus Poribacteria bacterium]
MQIRYTEAVEEIDEKYKYNHKLHSHQPIRQFEVSVLIDGVYDVETIECISHDAEILMDPDNPSRLTYREDDIQLEKDFVCSYTIKRVPTEDEDGAQLLFFESESLERTVEPTRLNRLGEIARSKNVRSMNIVSESISSTRQRGAVEKQLDRLSVSAPVLRDVSFGLIPPNGAAYHDVFHKGHGTNPFFDTEDDNLSTFAMDTDSASYSIFRRYLEDGNLPPPEAVRVEEFINAFDYTYPTPTEDAFAVHLEGAPSKLSKGKRLKLLKIGIQGQVVPDTDRKDAVLTFVIDVSGSMGIENRLGLVKRALRLLVDQLRPNDKIGIVVYGTDARVVLPHTSVVNKQNILDHIDGLCPEGVTNVEDGIRQGYELASRNLQRDLTNRVILCSDGVANEGVTSPELLLKEIRDYVDEGIYLTTVGFGMGNYNDTLMEELAKKGNGNYAYVDRLKEAKRIFVENLTGTLQVIAKDAKIQVKFNEDTVSRFRLIGYENRQMKHEDFRNDEADAGEIGSGHSVTALYEIKLHKNVDKGKLATVYIRHEDPDTAKVTEVKNRITFDDLKDSFEDASANFQFAALVAHFAEILRESVWVKESSLGAVQRTLKGLLPKLESGKSQDENQQRSFFSLVRKARRLKDMDTALKS